MMFWMRVFGLVTSLLACSGHASPAAASASASEPIANSALTAELFYQLLLGELHVREGASGSGFGLLLDAAQKTRDARLFQRALDIALQARAADAALNAAHTWKLSLPQATEPDVYALRILAGLHRTDEAAHMLSQLLADTPETDKPAVLASVPSLFAAAPEPVRTAQRVHAALGPELQHPILRPHAQLALAQLAQLQGHWADALQWLQRIPAEFEPLTIASHMAQVLSQMGRTLEAQHTLSQVPVTTPEQAKLKALTLSQWLREHDQAPQALATVTAALQLTAGDHELLLEQSMVLEQLHRYDDMEAVLRQRIQMRPQDPQAYNALGYTLADRGVRLPEALQLIQQALALAPNDPFIQDSLGWAHFRMGQHTQARAILERAYRSRPDAEIAAHLGEVLWTLGQQAQARRIWQEGLRLNARQATLLTTLQRFGVAP